MSLRLWWPKFCSHRRMGSRGWRDHSREKKSFVPSLIPPASTLHEVQSWLKTPRWMERLTPGGQTAFFTADVFIQGKRSKPTNAANLSAHGGGCWSRLLDHKDPPRPPSVVKELIFRKMVKTLGDLDEWSERYLPQQLEERL